MTRRILTDFRDFCNNLTKDQTRPMSRFVSEFLYGILQSKSVKLSKIGETFGEGNYHATIKRLSRNLRNDSLNEEKLWKRYLEIVSPQVHSRCIIALDPGEVCKEYAQHLEKMDYVHDGDKKEVRKGYPLIGIEAIHPNGKHTPLYLELFSRREINYKSDNSIIYKAIHRVTPYLPEGVFWIFDRGLDNEALFDELIKDNQIFLSRQRGDRLLEYEGKEIPVKKISEHIERKYRLKTTARKRGKDYHFDLRIGWIDVKIPGKREDFTLIVAHNPSKKTPFMFLTNARPNNSFEAIWCVKAYLMRWGIEEGFRLMKEQFELEDFRVQSLFSIKRLIMLVYMAWGFVGYFSTSQKQIASRMISKIWAPRKKVNFIYYRLVKAIKQVFENIGQTQRFILLMRFG